MSEETKPKTSWEIQYNRDKVKKWRLENLEYRKAYEKEHGKEYYEKNKEKRIEQSKAYYNNHKTTINERAKVKITCCTCGCVVTKGRLSDHKKTIKCKTIGEKQKLETNAEIIE